MKEKIIKSILDILILQLLRNNSFNSNQIIKGINKQFGARIDTTTINAVLARLENENLVTRITGKIYKSTQEGERTRPQMKKSYLYLQKITNRQLKER